MWSMNFEQKHRESKLTSNISGSFKNMIHTLAEKSQLKLYHQLINPLRKVVNYPEGSLINLDYDLFFNTNDRKTIYEIRFVDVKGTTYKPGMVIVIDASEIPVFGKIEKVFLLNNQEIFFVCKKFITLYFENHYYAFKFKTINGEEESVLVQHKEIHDFYPVLITYKEDCQYISSKYIL